MSGSTVRRGTAVGATVGALVLALVPSASAQAIVDGPSVVAACKIKSYSPKKVVVGAAVVKKTFAVRTIDCSDDGWRVTIYPYTNDLDKALPSASEEGTASISFPPKTFEKADAGQHIYGAFVTVAAGAQLQTSFTLQRRATFGSTFNATPEPVKNGKKITIKATLTRVSWTQKTAGKMPYIPFTRQPVALQFKAKDTSTYKTVKMVYSGTGGKVSTTVTAAKTGAWRFVFIGIGTTAAATSTGDTVTVN